MPYKCIKLPTCNYKVGRKESLNIILQNTFIPSAFIDYKKC